MGFSYLFSHILFPFSGRLLETSDVHRQVRRGHDDGKVVRERFRGRMQRRMIEQNHLGGNKNPKSMPLFDNGKQTM